jgi:lipoate---protein ligase
VVVGLGLRHRVSQIVDIERCNAAGVRILERRSGGGAVLVDRDNMLCGAICMPVPHPLLGDDLTASYRWLGEHFSTRLAALGVPGTRRVEVEEARSDVARLKSEGDALSRVLLAACYGALSPHEVVVGSAKLVGLAQIRRRHAALFQFGVLLQDQSPMADLLMVPDESTREELRAALRRRTVGLAQLLEPVPDYRALIQKISPRSAFPMASGVWGATPSSP